MREKKLSFQKLREIMRDANLKPMEKCVLFDLILYAGVDGNAFPSEKTLGQDFSVSDRHIRNVLKGLKNKKLLSWNRRGFSQSNKYDISEELYFHNDGNTRNYTSFPKGTTLPEQKGNPFPVKVSQERNQIKKARCNACEENECDNGYIFHDNGAFKCPCKTCHET